MINIVLCVVVRYFGGVKLGAGGLTRAYGNSAKKAIAASVLSEYIEYTDVTLELAYQQMQNFEYQLKQLGGKIIKQDFSENIRLQVRLPEEKLNLLAEQFVLC